MKYFKAISRILLILLFLGGTAWALHFTRQQHAKRVCNAVNIHIDTNKSAVFVTKDAIAEQLQISKLHPVGHQTATLNTYAIENFLLANCAIQEVNVFFQLSGEMNIEILQRQPIVRIENAQRQQFYIGSDGCLMATNPNHTARLVIANGHIPETFSANQNIVKPANDTAFRTPILNKIYELVTHIRNDEFLNALIDQIYVNANHEFELVPKIGNHLILLGKAENHKDQFKRLEQFYVHGVKKAGWEAYRVINLKYDNQVVCTKT